MGASSIWSAWRVHFTTTNEAATTGANLRAGLDGAGVEAVGLAGLGAPGGITIVVPESGCAAVMMLVAVLLRRWNR